MKTAILLLAGLVILTASVGGIESSVTSFEMLESTVGALVGALMAYAGVKSLKQ